MTELTTKQLAERLETDPKTLRRFLRALDKGVGTGARYAFTAREATALKPKFSKWLAEQPVKRVVKAKPAADKPAKIKAPKAERKVNDRAAGEARAAALDAALKARGSHVSQQPSV